MQSGGLVLGVEDPARSRQGLARTPIIALTANPLEEERKGLPT